VTVLLAVLLAFSFLMSIPPAVAAPFTGGVSPTIYGLRADLNGSGTVNGADDSNAFYGDTSIIDGMLDCDTWGATANAGTGGDGAITAGDDCTLVGYDGTVDGVTIAVVDGQFATANAVPIADGTALPVTYNDAAPANPSVAASDFGWSTIGGRVDANGNGAIDADDCSFGLIGASVDAGFGDPTDGVDILASGLCGFAGVIDPTLDGLVDLNNDEAITVADTCTGCFFGRDVASGFVDMPGGGGGGGGGGGTPSPTPPPTVVTHERTTPLTLEHHIVASGMLTVADGTMECASHVSVRLQRRISGDWRTVKSTMTDANGAFSVHLRDRVGRYRARVPRTTLASGDICARTTSPPVWHRH
jgi:hypothetical protein